MTALIANIPETVYAALPALVLGAAGAVAENGEAAIPGSFGELAKLGVVAGLLVYVIARQIPTMQKDAREEREKIVAAFREEIAKERTASADAMKAERDRAIAQQERFVEAIKGVDRRVGELATEIRTFHESAGAR